MGETVNTEFTLSGVGLHLGELTTVRIMPAAQGQGRHFVRMDLPGTPVIPADIEAVKSATLSTELSCGNASVRTVEHLLAALTACGVNDARIEIDGAEVPLLDGSAQNWCQMISQVALTQDSTQPTFGLSITEPVWIREEDSFAAALPASTPRLTYGIDFPYQEIGNQWHSWNPLDEDFTTEIAPARTFGFADQIEHLRQAGLIKGGSLENALVCSHEGWLNPPLRFTNEPVRHKLLDLVGDLSLLGFLPQAHIIAYKASHKLHLELAAKLAKLYGKITAQSRS